MSAADTDFSALYTALSPGLLLYIRQLAPSDAEDLVQEAFARLFLERPLPPEPKPWLILTLRRLALDRRKSLFRRLRRETAAARFDFFLPDPAAPLDAAQASALLRALPERQREVLTLRIWNDLPLAQVATLLGISTTTAHTDFQTALTTLRQKLEPVCPTPQTT